MCIKILRFSQINGKSQSSINKIVNYSEIDRKNPHLVDKKSRSKRSLDFRICLYNINGTIFLKERAVNEKIRFV